MRIDCGIAPDGLPLTIIRSGSQIASDARALRGGDGTSGYVCECSRCGKVWGPKWGYPVGFMVAAARSHAAHCGLPPLDHPLWKQIAETPDG